MNKPAPMSDEQIQHICNVTAAKGNSAGVFQRRLCQAAIAARDAQWESVVQELEAENKRMGIALRKILRVKFSNWADGEMREIAKAALKETT